MMNKKRYEALRLTVVNFVASDCIRTSVDNMVKDSDIIFYE